MVCIKTINSCSDAVAAAQKELVDAKNRRALLDFKGHQTECAVAVMGVHFNLSYLNRETGWSSKAIRGREMLILGAQKILNADIEKAEASLKAAEDTLRDALSA